MISEKISYLLKKNNLAQKDVYTALNLSSQRFSGYVLGKREPDAETLKKIADYFKVSVDYLIDNNFEYKPKNKKGIKIPVLGKVQAGVPVEAIEDIIDYEEITEEMARQGDFFALQVRGESMEPKFSEGDVVIVLKQTTVETGDIAIVLVNSNDATIKKIKRTESGIALIPLNPTFDVMFYTNEEIETLPITILGKVVELRAKF